MANPAAQSRHHDRVFDVIIVGCGPVGAVAACLLGQRGLNALVLDRTDWIYDKPRAVSIDHEIARTLQNIGLADAVDAISEPFTASEYFGVDGQLIKRFDMLPPPYPMGWTPSMVFLQPAFEQRLRRRMAELPAVTCDFDASLVAIEDNGDHVVARVRAASGDEHTVRGRYLIGCDGASSAVRAIAGIELDDLGFDQSWLVVDVRANDRGLARLPKVSAQYCEPSRPTTYLVCTGNHRRWEFKLKPGEDPRQMETPDEVWRLLARWIGREDADLWRAASYRFHALVARDWRKGRVFVAGDAAHQQPPFLGQGLCQGIRDVTNLAWKFERVLHGRSGDALLETYGVERGGHVRRLHSVIIGIGGLVGEVHVERARARDARLITEAGGTVRSVPRQNLQPPLDGGCITTRPDTRRGTLFPQPMVAHGETDHLMDDITGAVGRVVLSARFAGWNDTLARRAEALGLTVLRITAERPGSGHPLITAYSERDGIADAWFAAADCDAAIIRPDHYVFATATDASGLSIAVDDYMRSVCDQG